MSITKPLSTATVNGKPVRFFHSPLPGVNFPWHAFLDLHAAMDLTAGEQEHFLRMMRSGPFKDSTRVLATEAGPTVIAAHHVAQGFISALEHIGRSPPLFERDYYKGLSAAIDAQSAGMSEAGKFSLVIAMGRRHIAGQVDE
jgi:hypothetical protein